MSAWSGVVDVDQPRAVELAARYQTQAFVDYRDLFGRVECVSIAVPTQLHHAIARDFWPRGVDVLVEKPLTATGAEGRELVELAARAGRILQVGHLERL